MPQPTQFLLRSHLLMMACFILSACVSSPPLRKVTTESIREFTKFDTSPEQQSPDPDPKLTAQRDAAAANQADKVQVEKYTQSNFWIAHVEFDDFGTLAQPWQLDEIEKEVQSEGARSIFRNGITTVAFVHGWHNNAERDNGNLANFRKMIAKLATDPKNSGRGVLGVFLSWRGETTKVPILRHLSYWSRKATAHSIGHGNLSEVLVRLKNLNLVLADRKGSGFATYYANSRLVLVGHSFGAAALYSAVADPLKTDFLQAYYRGKSSASHTRRMELVTGFGDLVLLINPAFEALQYRIIDYHIRYNDSVDYAATQPVLMMIAGSKGDSANKNLFRIGQTLGNAWRLLSRRRTETPAVPSNKTQGEQLTTSVGSWDAFATHTLAHGSDGRGTLLHFAPLKADHRNVTKYLTAPNPTPSGQPLTPFMVVSVDANLIQNHSDIWRQDFGKFLVDFVSAQSRYSSQSKGQEMQQQIRHRR